MQQSTERIVPRITATVGNTPLVRLTRLTRDVDAEVLVKMESHNPLGSVKDRIGLAMIEAAERDGVLRPGATIAEATSGNTGIALAYIGAVKGYRVVLVMPDAMSMERRRLLQAFGAEIVLTPGHKGMQEAVTTVERIARKTPGCFLPRQFDNPANPQIHYQTTAEEIIADSGGAVDIFVSVVGTGGTISGVARRLREVCPNVKIVAVEPASSPQITCGVAGPHRIQGIGPNFIAGNFDRSLVDEILLVEDEQATETARALARSEGIFCGISAGANVYCALQIAARPTNARKRIVTIICDTGERYISTWLFANPLPASPLD